MMTPVYVGTVLGLVVLAYVGLGAIVFLTQHKLVYIPHRYSLPEAQTRASGLDLRLWPKPGGDYHGFIHDDSPVQPRGVVLLFHGNAGSALDRTYYVSQLEHLGFRVILFEYPGYGARMGRRRERDLVAAGISAARLAFEQFGQPLILTGESLGCGVAAATAASKEVPIRGLLLITPWDTLPNLAQSLYWFLPAKLFTRDRYDNVRNLRRWTGPVAMVTAERDEIIPSRNSRRLYDSLTCPKRLWALPGVGHNGWPAAVDEQWWSEVMGLVAGQPVTPPSPPQAAIVRP